MLKTCAEMLSRGFDTRLKWPRFFSFSLVGFWTSSMNTRFDPIDPAHPLQEARESWLAAREAGLTSTWKGAPGMVTGWRFAGTSGANLKLH